MSETTFTLHDLNRTPAKVLAACDRYGQVTIRTRSGKTYRVVAERSRRRNSSVSSVFRAHWKRLRELGNVPPRPDEMERINQIIAGEI